MVKCVAALAKDWGWRNGEHTFPSTNTVITKAIRNFLSLLALTPLVALPLSAQTITQAWAARYNGPAGGQDYAIATAVNSAGDAIVTGYSYNASGNADCYTAKYALADGELLWERRYNGAANGNDVANSVALDAAGNVIIAGYSSSASNADFYTAKYAAADGALLWEVFYNGTGNSYDSATGVSVDAAGNVVVTGQSYNASGYSDFYTAKYAAATGALLWEKRYSGVVPGNNVAYGLAVDAAGNATVAGSSYDGAGYNYYTAHYAAADGAVLWERSYNGPANSYDAASAVALDATGNAVVTGQSFNAVNSDFYTAKYAAADGALLWESRYNGPANSFDVGRGVAVDAAGKVAITGSSYNGVSFDSYTAKLAAADGALLWERRYNSSGNGEDQAYSVVSDVAGNVFVTGQSSNGSNLDFYTAKYAVADGAIVWEQRYNGPANNSDVMNAVTPQIGKIAVSNIGDVIVAGQSSNGTNYDFATVRYAPPDVATQAPTLTAPATAAAMSTSVAVSFSLPEKALAGTVKLTFTGATTTTLTLANTVFRIGTYSFTFAPASPVSTSGGFFASSSSATLPDGSYSVALSYQDFLGNPVAAATSTGVVIDTVTLAPTLTSPASATNLGSAFTVAFTLPEAASVATLRFGTHVLTLAASQRTSGTHSFTLNPTNPTASPEIASGDPVPDGLHSLTYSYQDLLQNAAATTASRTVRVDTVVPTLSGTFSPLTFYSSLKMPNYLAKDVNGVPLFYTASDATGVTLTQVPAAASTVTPGDVLVTITARDAAQNSTSLAFHVTVRPASAVSAVAALQGAPVPGAGAVGGPPADALLASFGTPATDDASDIAYTAKWTSATGGKGSGIIKNTTCVAKVGGTVPGITGATFKTVTDPIVESGHIGFIATFAGVLKTKASAVMSDTTGALAVVARAGDPAPGAGDATFKTFKAISLMPSGVAFFAQLAGGTSTAKVSAANDLALYATDATHSPTLILREGQVIGTHTIKTLITYLPGLGSTGQGRGWATAPSTTMALALFVDKTQAVLSADITGAVTVLSQSGPGGAGAPAIAGSTFASYSFPALNAAGHSAFLGTLTLVPGTIVKQNQRAIFTRFGTATYASVARLSDVHAGTGSFFNLLKDPVLAADDGLAFPATMKGGTATGLAANVLWWKPPGGALAILAQGGGQPGDVATGAQYKVFKNLAIASTRGPIFAATLASGKGGVTAATATGVWAKDFTGAVRALFRTGDSIIGKPLKKFTLLTASVGSTGVTRSFNNVGEVVWLATFSDKTTAIIRTQIP